MFNNIGGKIKVLSIVVMIVGVLFSIIYGIVLLVGGNIGVGLLVLLGGPFLSWTSVFVIYGLGELIEKTSENADNTKKLLQLNAINSVNQPQNREEPPVQTEKKKENSGTKTKSNKSTEPANIQPTQKETPSADTMPSFLKVLQDEIITDVMAGALSDKVGEEIDPVNIPKANECPACFHPITPDDEYCNYCGQKLK